MRNAVSMIVWYFIKIFIIITVIIITVAAVAVVVISYVVALLAYMCNYIFYIAMIY